MAAHTVYTTNTVLTVSTVGTLPTMKAVLTSETFLTSDTVFVCHTVLRPALLTSVVHKLCLVIAYSTVSPDTTKRFTLCNPP